MQSLGWHPHVVEILPHPVSIIDRNPVRLLIDKNL